MKGQKKITKMSKIDNIYKLYSAFANTYGGTILLGVVEHMNEHDNAKRL